MKPALTFGNSRLANCQDIDAGFTLTELLVALGISSLLLAALLHSYTNGSAAYRDAEALAELEERLVYAFRELEYDLLLAGFWGYTHDAALIDIVATSRVHCAGNDVSAWALQLTRAIEARDAAMAHPCPPFSLTVPGTDSFSLRYLSTEPASPENGRLQVLAATTHGVLFDDGTIPASTAPAEVRNLQISSWYIDQSSSEPGLPALRRYFLVAGGLLEHQEIMPGIGDLQLRLGIDRDADGLTDGWVNPIDADTDTMPVHAVRISLQAISNRHNAGGQRQQLRAERTFARRNRPAS